MLVQTPDIPRVFLVEPQHKAALQRALLGNGRSRRNVWLEQQRARQAAQDDAAAEKSALEDPDIAEDDKKGAGAAAARVSKENLALEFLRRKERTKLAEQDSESTLLNSAAAAIDWRQ